MKETILNYLEAKKKSYNLIEEYRNKLDNYLECLKVTCEITKEEAEDLYDEAGEILFKLTKNIDGIKEITQEIQDINSLYQIELDTKITSRNKIASYLSKNTRKDIADIYALLNEYDELICSIMLIKEDVRYVLIKNDNKYIDKHGFLTSDIDQAVKYDDYETAEEAKRVLSLKENDINIKEV